MTQESSSCLPWVRLSLHPLRYSHASWQPPLPVAVDALSVPARQAVETWMCRQLDLKPLKQDDVRTRGARVGLIVPALHAVLVDALLALSAPDVVPPAPGSQAAQLAGMLGEHALPWRRLHAATSDLATRRRLLAQQLAARLCVAALPLGEAWAGRWRLRHARALELDSVRTTATVSWWAHLEDCLHQLHGGPEKLPCL